MPVAGAIGIGGLGPAADAARGSASTGGTAGSAFADLLRQADGAHGGLDDAIRRAAGTPGLGAGDLLALQAQMYRSSLELDLASKIVEKVSSGIKQTLATNT